MVITDEALAEAMARHCALCHAVPDAPCVNFVTHLPMQDRTVHFCRLGAK